MLMKFFAPRRKIIAAILATIYILATFGIWLVGIVPYVGTAIFIAGLWIWLAPAIVFEWTGYFRYHEFGGSPTGWQGHLIMFAFYFAIATLISLPFGKKQPKNKS